MPKVKVVIGANYGDEGKGLMTDYFCAKEREVGREFCVVLSNGGAQRGHTVDTPSGMRHVFKQYGSGLFAGADTFIPSQFLVNPLALLKEYNDLYLNQNIPAPFVHVGCPVTTPWDVMANMIIEESRQEKHGTCGMGIWETVKRSQNITITWGLIENAPEYFMKEILPFEVQNYYTERFYDKGIFNLPNGWQDVFYSKDIADVFFNYVQNMKRIVQTVNDLSVLDSYDTVVFENAQGLLLSDENTSCVKYTTPSKTGLDNPVDIMKRIHVEDVEVCYVTRSYLTRHGAGNLENECKKEDLGDIGIDETNRYNDFQGGLRYGRLDIDALLKRTTKDYLKIGNFRPDSSISLAMTHTNECRFPIDERTKNFDELFDWTYNCYGKTRNEVIKV